MESIQQLRDQLEGSGATITLAHKLKHLLDNTAEGDRSGKPILKVAVISQETATSIVDGLRCALVLEGFTPRIYEAQAGSFWQELLDPASGIRSFAPTLIVVAPSLKSFGGLPDLGSSQEEAEKAAEGHARRLRKSCCDLGTRLECKIILQNIVLPSEFGIGAWERQLPGGEWSFVTALNRHLMEELPPDILLMDVDRLAGRIGLQNWRNPAFQAFGELPFDPRHLPDYTRLLRSCCRAAMGRLRKCLVTDLDNTLWRGVIGDDGVEGIEIGNDSPVGRGHLDFCLYLKELRRRGVILAVCSKNAPDIARLGFTHPSMPLQVEDFAAFQCSWQDKASGLRNIATQLNIGVDSLVFVDDNPAECLLIRQKLPEVQIIDLPQDAARFRGAVDSAMPFVFAQLSTADRGRADSYTALDRAARLKEESTDLDTYLRSLAMRSSIRPVRPTDYARVIQMEQRVNQFNLTTRRYSGADWERICGDPVWFCFVVDLADRFANHGTVSSIILRKEGGTLWIDSWLMSCRAFSRGLEQFILNHILKFAEGENCDTLIGQFVPTDRNKVVADLYPRLGFLPRSNDTLPLQTWTCPVPSRERPCFIEQVPSNGA